ncbi:MAG: DEAD/DEAH box helicase [Anaerolineae bacterium]
METTLNTEQTAFAETFAQLGLSEPLIQLLVEVGYEAPTSIQQQTIPLLLAGRDLIGQAQTGTGKTAAFALPILDRLELSLNAVQALVLTPTRELAIQVAEAIHTYSKYLGRVRVLPIYGGDAIGKQINRLRSGLHIVVGTPGRVIDHLKRGTLDLAAVKMVVIDEADEMLRMGFIEDVEWILGQTPADRQTALFSATIPREVRRIADRHLDQPASIEIKRKTLTVATVEQRYVHVLEKQKVDALTHLLETEAEEGEAILIFASTKVGVADLADKLQARGYAAEAMHGDMTQAQRESVIRRLREEQVEIVVATDVAARGLDIEHIGHVINFDMPNDPESYVHRIGRTARAGRTGKAILFVTPRETRLLKAIEQFTGQRLTAMKVPSHADVAARRTALFKARLLKTLENEDLDVYLTLVEELAEESGKDLAEIAAAAARMARGNKPLDVPPPPEPEPIDLPLPDSSKVVMLYIDAGRNVGMRPADLVGAIANESNLPGKYIGPLEIFDYHSVVGVPAEYQTQVLTAMASATVRGQAANIRLATPRDTGQRDKSARRDKTAHRDKAARRPSSRATDTDIAAARATAERLRNAKRTTEPKVDKGSKKKPHKRAGK